MDGKRTFNKGKVVYWIKGHWFENSKDKKDAKLNAETFCLDNFLNPADIQKFDSETECRRYEFLLDLQSKGEISNLSHHYTLRIIGEFTNENGDLIPELTYEADFIYKDNRTGQRIVEDVKGSEYFIDESFITKKKAFDYIMKDKGLWIKIVLYRSKEWVEYKLGQPKKSSKMLKKQREQIKALKAENHAKEIAERKQQKELARLNELKYIEDNGCLSYSQKKRLEELRGKYGSL